MKHLLVYAVVGFLAYQWWQRQQAAPALVVSGSVPRTPLDAHGIPSVSPPGANGGPPAVPAGATLEEPWPGAGYFVPVFHG